jgi:hypothetical protein
MRGEQFSNGDKMIKVPNDDFRYERPVVPALWRGFLIMPGYDFDNFHPLCSSHSLTFTAGDKIKIEMGSLRSGWETAFEYQVPKDTCITLKGILHGFRVI